ncbi:MAG: Polyketide cyclase / dehydrase and lipid transport [Actinomycetia bacterium]|nr:Polyketide cyclase / dehydrase and lipid transport [Actinomycetes bacterium]
MTRRTVVATRHSTAAVEQVWALLSQARTWKDWGSFTVAELEREGDPAPDGVGAVRRFGFPMYASREEVVAFEPPHHLGYTMLKGLPITGYRSDVTLAVAPDGGTDLRWESSFDARPADGWFWAGFLRFLITDFSRRLAKAAARG